MILRNQKLFLIHIFLRDFFNSLIALSWAYLLINGISLFYIILGLFVFRALESFIFIPISRKIISKDNYKFLSLVSLLLQGIYLILILYTPHHPFLFIFVIIIICIWDTLYWPIRTNLERTTSDVKEISKGVGFSHTITVIAGTLGFLITPFFLAKNDLITIFIASLGFVISYLPLHFLKDGEGINIKEKKTFYAMVRKNQSFLSLFGIPIVWLIGLIAALNEIMTIFFPLLLSFHNAQLITIGVIFAFFNVITFISTFAAGYLENNKKRKFFYYLGLFSLFVVIVFFYLPVSYVSAFLIIFAMTTTPMRTYIIARGQKYVQKNFIGVDGGYFIEFVDMGMRILVYPFILVFLFIHVESYFHHILLLISFIALVGMLIVSKVKRID